MGLTDDLKLRDNLRVVLRDMPDHRVLVVLQETYREVIRRAALSAEQREEGVTP